ncbi:YCF49-like protein [Tasmannia lanceolata]|uniref:YCF49-like protein n=1 Tax=Tasmannia lanceolata TaxID=3420 RepID=UPI0040640694
MAAASAFCFVLSPRVPSSSSYLSNPIFHPNQKFPVSLSFSRQIPTPSKPPPQNQTPSIKPLVVLQTHSALPAFLSFSFALASFPNVVSALEFPSWASSLPLQEPQNALSLPTWAIHVSSVVEWITAMALVWQYGEESGNESWKGLSWGMVPLLGGAFCACTWHFFYNSESLEILVALQAALTVLGNFTMCIAAFRIYRSSQGGSENP